jgi:hypothetical protein
LPRLPLTPQKAWQVNGAEHEPNSRAFEVDCGVIKEAAETGAQQPLQRSLTQKPPRRKRGAADLGSLADALAGIAGEPLSASKPPRAAKGAGKQDGGKAKASMPGGEGWAPRCWLLCVLRPQQSPACAAAQPLPQQPEPAPRLPMLADGAAAAQPTLSAPPLPPVVVEALLPNDYVHDAAAKAAFDAALLDFWKKQGRSKLPSCNITRESPADPYRLWWEVHAWGGFDKASRLQPPGPGPGPGPRCALPAHRPSARARAASPGPAGP